MKKLFRTFLSFLIAALVVEVIVLIVSKVVGWDSFVQGRPIAVIAHVHLLGLGALVFLVMICLEKLFAITKHKRFSVFYIIYLVGIALSVAVMLYRGFTQLFGGQPIGGLTDALAAIGHTVVFVGLFFFAWILKDVISDRKHAEAESNVDKKDAEKETSSN